MSLSKEQKVHTVFEKISVDYDKMNSVISFNQHKKWRDDIMSRMNVHEGAHALDVCCGTADWTIAIAEATGSNGHVTGLDFSEGMLEAGRSKVAAHPNITLVQGNAMELPFPDDSFDFVTIGFGLRNVPDYLTVLQEMNRVLKPGGMIACLETSQSELQVTGSYSAFILNSLCLYWERYLQKVIKNIHGFKNRPMIFQG